MKLAFYFLLFPITCLAQDADMQAQAYYTRAEDYYNTGTVVAYEDCLRELLKAEKALGNTNSKILYLKTITLDKLVAQAGIHYIADLDSSVSHFFRITDSKTFPAEKYYQAIFIRDHAAELKKIDTDAKNSIHKESNSPVTLGIKPDYVYEESGVRIDEIIPGKPAAIAGLQEGDVIIQLDEHQVTSIPAYFQALGQFTKGSATKLRFRRRNEIRVVDVAF